MILKRNILAVHGVQYRYLSSSIESNSRTTHHYCDERLFDELSLISRVDSVGARWWDGAGDRFSMFLQLNDDVEVWQLVKTAHRSQIRQRLSSARCANHLGRCSNSTSPLRAGRSACRRAHRQPGLFIGQWGRRDAVVHRLLTAAH